MMRGGELQLQKSCSIKGTRTAEDAACDVSAAAGPVALVLALAGALIAASIITGIAAFG